MGMALLVSRTLKYPPRTVTRTCSWSRKASLTVGLALLVSRTLKVTVLKYPPGLFLELVGYKFYIWPYL
jgi:hypothetical protein